jgi:subtilisin family serine protease
MHLPAAQEQADGRGVTIALIDATLDLRTPDLRGADIHMKKNCDGLSDHRLDRPNREQSHGSSMATLLVGTGRGTAPGGAGMLGIVPGATVNFYPLDTKPEPAGEATYIECDAVKQAHSMEAAMRDGADIISTSTGSNKSASLARQVVRAARQGAVVVASSGDTSANRYGIEFPAGHRGVVAVNAVDSRARPWSKNPRPVLNPCCDPEYPVISAPGVDVEVGGYVAGRGWVSGEKMTGTSPATAIVAGSLALVKSKYPRATGNQLIQNLIHFTGGTRPYSWDARFGFGIVSVTKMLAHDPTGWPDVNPLMGTPRDAIRKFPMSAYRAPGSAGQAAASATPSAQQSPSGAAADRQAASQQTSSTGLPGWTWPLAGVAVLAAAGALLVVRRGRRGPTPDPHTKEA